MPKTLVIVESPAKAKTIGRYLGSSYDVIASFGHVRDLPDSASDIPEAMKKHKWAKLGVDTENGFEPLYVVPRDKKSRVSALKDSAKTVDTILLATDEDREGESISWHVLEVIKPKKGVDVKRIVFHEITPEAIQDAIKNPRALDLSLVKAQETRRILDRLYGYTLSPLLWRKIGKGLSAGRVQSVAVRIIVMRERERREFVEAAYCGMTAQLFSGQSFDSKLFKVGTQDIATGADFNEKGELTKKVLVLDQAAAKTLHAKLKDVKSWKVVKMEAKPGFENPPPPFMTSTLQQEANRKFGYSSKMTMQIAQTLYEGVSIGGEATGLITYMRTDSLNLAERALSEAKQVIGELFGKEYQLSSPKRWASKAKNAQEAHEAIRPTDLNRQPAAIRSYLSKEQFNIYDLIWKRTLACQMPQAKVTRLRAEIQAEDSLFASSGKTIDFPGFLRAYVEGSDDPDAELSDKERVLPPLKEGDLVTLENLEVTNHVTTPPARYTEASLVKKLEAEGIGRPSTYASIIGTIQDRGYVNQRGKELVPTWTAFGVTQLLEDHFGKLVDLRFTAEMEDDLDEIADGKRDATEELTSFYFGTKADPGIEPQVNAKAADIPFPNIPVAPEIVVRLGRNGPFLQRGEGGPGNTANIPESLAPADLTEEQIVKLFDMQAKGAEPAIVDDSGNQIFFKSGRYGPYIEMVTEEETKRVSIPPGDTEDSLTQEDVVNLFRFPVNLGEDEHGVDIMLQIGRYGAYLVAGDRNANLGDWRPALAMDAAAAMEALNAPKTGRAAGRSAKPEPMKVLGKADGLEGEIKVMSGRYGPYVTDGTTNATLPKSHDPETVTLEQAAELIKAKAAAGPSKKKPFKRRRS